MKTDCYIVKRKLHPLDNPFDEIVGITETFEEAKELKLLIAKKEFSTDPIHPLQAVYVEKFANEFYIITKESYYSKPFRIEEL